MCLANFWWHPAMLPLYEDICISQPLLWTGGYPGANLLQPFTMEEVQGTHHMVDKAGLWEPELKLHVEMPCIERGVMSGFSSMFPFPFLCSF